MSQEDPKTEQSADGRDHAPVRGAPWLRGSVAPWQLVILLALALALRLLVWRWHAQQPLGGDEQEYFSQALTLLRERRYVELNLMRPPLYTAFLAACGYLLDTFVQRIRLVQAVISALTVLPVWLLTRDLFGRRAALLAGLMVALDITLASAATELLTETLFVFGLAWALWLLWRATNRPMTTDRRQLALSSGHSVIGSFRPSTWNEHTVSSWPSFLRFFVVTFPRLGSDAILAGLAVGLLTLLRSVALPLLPLGALLLLLRPAPRLQRLLPPALYLLAALLVILPWTARNYAHYGALILVDTTGAENLWLDNNPAGQTPADPLGREAAKRALYALKEDRAARQSLAVAQGRAAIIGNPGWFAAKAWGEAKKLFALQFFDDMRARRAIWLPPAEVWLRLLFGDALWLLVAGAGLAGLAVALARRSNADAPIAALCLLWCGYVALTMLIFHVELRYRLPLYPALWPFAAAGLLRAWAAIRARPATRLALLRLPTLALLLLVPLPLLMALVHRPYLAESWRLAQKHSALWQAERALAADDPGGARAAALSALALDNGSALGRVALSRAALLSGDVSAALAPLDAAIQSLPEHPYAHLLRGALRRRAGDLSGARRDLAYERVSREDLQSWASDVVAPIGPPAGSLQLGDGLDLGYITGFAPALGPNDAPGYRWTTAASQIQLTAPAAATTLRLRLASGRPAGAAAPEVTVLINGALIGVVRPSAAWQEFALPLGAARGPLSVTLRSATFTPRQFDRASPDGRTLGVQVQAVSVEEP